MSAEVWEKLVEIGVITDEMQRLYEAFDSSRSYGYGPDVKLDGNTDTLTVVGSFEDREYQAEIRWRLADVPGKIEADGQWYRKAFRLRDFALQKHQSIVDVDHCTVDDQWSDQIWLRSPAKVAKAVLLGDDKLLAHKSLSYLDEFPWYIPADEDQWVDVDEPQWQVVHKREGVAIRRVRVRRSPEDHQRYQQLTNMLSSTFDSLAEAEALVASATPLLTEGESLEIQMSRITQRGRKDGQVTDQTPFRPLDWVEPEEVEEPEPEIPLSKVKLPTKGVPGHPGLYWRWERAKDSTSTMIIILRDGEGGWCVQATPTWTGNRSWDEILAAGEIVEVRVPTKRAALEAAHERFGR